MKLQRPIEVPILPTVISNECLEKIEMLKWCIVHNPQPKICEPILKDLSNCYTKFFMYNA